MLNVTQMMIPTELLKNGKFRSAPNFSGGGAY